MEWESSMMKQTPVAVAMKFITREDLLCVNTKTRSDIGIPDQQWMIEGHERFFLCYCCNETGPNYDEPLRWLTTGLSKQTTGLSEEGRAKPPVIVTQMPHAVGTASITKWYDFAHNVENHSISRKKSLVFSPRNDRISSNDRNG